MLSWGKLVARLGGHDRAERAVADGFYRRVLRNAYVDDVVPDGPLVRATALRQVLPSEAALAGRSALWALGVDVLPDDERLDVVTVRGRHLVARPGVRTWSALLPDDELVDLPGGLLAVCAARAVVDVARRERLVEAVAVGDAVLRAGATNVELLALAVERAAGLRGVLAARRMLPHLEPRSESQGESRLRMQLVLGGLPRPQAQVDYYNRAGEHVARADLVLEGAVLEYDGREQRLRKPVFVSDRRRQNALVEAGVELRRYVGADVVDARRAWLCAQVLRAVRAAAKRPAPELVRGADTLRAPRLRPAQTRAESRRSSSRSAAARENQRNQAKIVA